MVNKNYSQLDGAMMENEEIDILQLLRVLWNKKWWILVSTLICLCLSVGYTFTIKKQWTSVAEIIVPQIEDVQEYLEVNREYARIIDNEVDLTELKDSLFYSFMRLASSSDQKEKFFKQLPFYIDSSKALDENNQRRLLTTLSEKMLLTSNDFKKNPENKTITLTFTADNPIDAQNILTDFVQFINQSASVLESKKLYFLLAEKNKDLSYQKRKLESETTTLKDIKLNELNTALDIVKRLNEIGYNQNETISNTGLNLSINEQEALDKIFTSYVLNDKFLRAKIDILSKENKIASKEYIDLSDRITSLDKLLDKSKSLKISTFHYQSSPSYPLSADKTKKPFIIAIGTLFGLVCSIIFTLLFWAMRSSKK